MLIEVPMSDVEVVTYNGEELKNLVIDNMKWRKRTNFVPTLNNHTQLSLSRTAGENDNTLDWYGRIVRGNDVIKVCPADTLHISCSTQRGDFYCDYEDEDIAVQDVETITREYTALQICEDKIYFSGAASPYEDLSEPIEYLIAFENEDINAALYPPAVGDHIKISGRILSSIEPVEFTWHRVVNSINSDESVNLGLLGDLKGGSSFVHGALRYTISPVKLCNNPHGLIIGVSIAADRAVPILPSLSIYPKITITSIGFADNEQLHVPNSVSDSMTTSSKITISAFNRNPMPVTVYIKVYDRTTGAVVGSANKAVKAQKYVELEVPLKSSYNRSQIWYDIWVEDHDTTNKDFLFQKSIAIRIQ